MDSNIDPKNDLDSCLWEIFFDEYISQQDFLDWVDFMNKKDLGIKYAFYEKSKLSEGYINYEIIDEKKWLLNKIKYGI